MDCAPKVCIAVINREKSSLARECARTSAHFGLIRRIKRDEKKCRLIGKWRCWILARLFECAPLRTHGHFEKIDYESQSWRNGCLDVIRAEGTCHRREENLVPRCNRSEKCLFEKPEHRGGVFRRWQKMCEPIADEKEKHSKKIG